MSRDTRRQPLQRAADALLSERPYKHAWTVDAALSEIGYQSGKHFDPRLAQLFLTLAPELLAEVGLR